MEKYQPHMRDELHHTWESYRNGTVRDIYFRQDRPGVAIFVECDSTAEARRILSDFPLAKAGLIDFDVIPLGPFTNREMLFAQASSELGRQAATLSESDR